MFKFQFQYSKDVISLSFASVNANERLASFVFFSFIYCISVTMAVFKIFSLIFDFQQIEHDSFYHIYSAWISLRFLDLWIDVFMSFISILESSQIFFKYSNYFFSNIFSVLLFFSHHLGIVIICILDHLKMSYRSYLFCFSFCSLTKSRNLKHKLWWQLVIPPHI